MKVMLTAGLGALALGGLAAGALVTGTTATAGDRSAARSSRDAVRAYKDAVRALARQDGATAVPLAERAVLLAPREAAYRALLGQSYVQAGRFASARTALAEALRLDPANGRAALSLALSQVAGGDWTAARETLDANAGSISPADRGLALALAGDPAAGVRLLTEAARQPGAAVKTRQNLALALALGGDWRMARVIAAADLSPAELDSRMTAWAAFAQPHAAADQVAELLGVTPAADPGRPELLALDRVAATAVASAEPVAVRPAPTPASGPVPAPAPVVASAAAPAPAAPVAVAVAAYAPVPAAAPVPAPMVQPAFRFAARREVVQPLPAPLIRPEPTPARVAFRRAVAARAAAVAAPRPASGAWYVQLGAYDNAGVARDAWGRARRRFGQFAGRTPTGATFRAGQRGFYRLSVGGYARADAVDVCRRYRSAGGACFVRAAAGDQLAQWLRPSRQGVQVAMR